MRTIKLLIAIIVMAMLITINVYAAASYSVQIAGVSKAEQGE